MRTHVRIWELRKWNQKWPQLNCWLIVLCQLWYKYKWISMLKRKHLYKFSPINDHNKSGDSTSSSSNTKKDTFMTHYVGFFNESHKNNNDSYNLKYISNELEVMASSILFLFNEFMICIWKPKRTNATHIYTALTYHTRRR